MPINLFLRGLLLPQGRNDRTNYWFCFAIFLFLETLAFGLFLALLITTDYGETPSLPLTIATWLASMAGIWVNCAAAIRRLHDLGLPAWWVIGYLASATFLIFGWLVAVILLGTLPSQARDNRYGPAPGLIEQSTNEVTEHGTE